MTDHDPVRADRRNVLAGSALAAAAVLASTAAAQETPATGEAVMSETHPNVAVIQQFFQAYAAKDVGRVRELLAPDIVWTIPGHHPLSGPKRGVDEVLAFFDQLARANFKAEPLVIAAQGDYVVDHHRGWSDEGQGLDITWCLVFRFENGRIKDVTNFSADQHRADLFFWSVYSLKPIPDRLA